MQLGFKKNEALVLVALEEGCKKAKEIVSKYGIRQTDVSEALRSLIKRGFVREVGKLKEHKVGRPVKLYSLTSDLNNNHSKNHDYKLYLVLSSNLLPNTSFYFYYSMIIIR